MQHIKIMWMFTIRAYFRKKDQDPQSHDSLNKDEIVSKARMSSFKEPKRMNNFEKEMRSHRILEEWEMVPVKIEPY